MGTSTGILRSLLEIMVVSNGRECGGINYVVGIFAAEIAVPLRKLVKMSAVKGVDEGSECSDAVADTRTRKPVSGPPSTHETFFRR